MSTAVAALVNGAILGAFLTFVVWLILRMSPRTWFNAATKYAIWSILLLAVVAMPLLYLASEQPSTAAVGLPPNVRAPVLAVPSGAKAAPLKTAFLKPAHRVLFPFTRPGDRWMQGILTLWAVTASVMLLRVGVSIISLSRRKAQAFAPPASLSSRLEPWLTSCGTRRPVLLACSDEIATPMVAGLWRPAILFPVRLLAQLNEEEWDQAGLHEAAHVARWDDIALVAQRILEALFCFHPVVLWISRRMDLEREIACDDFVLAATQGARSYAACLTRVLELAGETGSSGVAAAAIEEGSHLTRRVQALLDQTRNSGTRLLGGRLTGFVVLFVTLAWMGWRSPLTIAFAAPPAQAPAVRIIAQTRAQAQPPQSPTPPPAGAAKPLRRTSGPVSICLVLDNSGSMGDKRIGDNQARSYVARLMLSQGFRSDDEVCIVSFSDDSFLDQPFTNDARRIEDALSKGEARGGSAIRGAISMTIDYMKSKGTRDKKVMVVVTDGDDTSSAETQDQLLRKVKDNGISIYCIGLPNRDVEETEKSKKSLRELSEASGGRAYYAKELPDVQKAASEIMGMVRSE